MRKLLFFHAPWCPPCRLFERELIHPLQSEVSREQVVSINVQEDPFAADKYNITRIPRAILTSGEEVVDWSVGIADLERCLIFLKGDTP